MTNEQTSTVTAANLDALAAKLEQFGEALPPGEQDAFTLLLQAASMWRAENEVQGYFTLIELTPTPGLISSALGINWGDATLLPAVQRAREG